MKWFKRSREPDEKEHEADAARDRARRDLEEVRSRWREINALKAKRAHDHFSEDILRMIERGS